MKLSGKTTDLPGSALRIDFLMRSPHQEMSPSTQEPPANSKNVWRETALPHRSRERSRQIPQDVSLSTNMHIQFPEETHLCLEDTLRREAEILSRQIWEYLSSKPFEEELNSFSMHSRGPLFDPHGISHLCIRMHVRFSHPHTCIAPCSAWSPWKCDGRYGSCWYSHLYHLECSKSIPSCLVCHVRQILIGDQSIERLGRKLVK